MIIYVAQIQVSLRIDNARQRWVFHPHLNEFIKNVGGRQGVSCFSGIWKVVQKIQEIKKEDFLKLETRMRQASWMDATSKEDSFWGVHPAPVQA